MNLQRPNANDATRTFNRSKNVSPSSGICSRCIDGCRGNCEVFKASFRGREVIYPGPYGKVTAGGDKDYPVDYSHFNIQGTCVGAFGIPADSELATFPAVDCATNLGRDGSIELDFPVFTGAVGSTRIARVNWDEIAIGAAISGIIVVAGENICGMDKEAELKNGRIVRSRQM